MHHTPTNWHVWWLSLVAYPCIDLEPAAVTRCVVLSMAEVVEDHTDFHRNPLCTLGCTETGHFGH